MDELKLLEERDISTAVTSIRLALSKLLRTTLRGMFDGPSTVSIEQMSGQGVVVDLSSVFSNRDALPLVQMATASTLAGQMAALSRMVVLQWGQARVLPAADFTAELRPNNVGRTLLDTGSAAVSCWAPTSRPFRPNRILRDRACASPPRQ